MSCYNLECFFKERFPEVLKTGQVDLDNDGVAEKLEDLDKDGLYSEEELWRFLEKYHSLVDGYSWDRIDDIVLNCEDKIKTLQNDIRELPYIHRLCIIKTSFSSRGLARSYEHIDQLYRGKAVKELLARNDFRVVPDLVRVFANKWNAISNLPVFGGKVIWPVEYTMYFQPLVEAMGNFKDARAVPVLQAVVDSCPQCSNEGLKTSAKEALKRVGASEAAIKLVKLYKKNVREWTEEESKQAQVLFDQLKKSKDPTAIPVLLEILKDKRYSVDDNPPPYPESALEAYGEQVIPFIERDLENMKRAHIPELKRGLENFELLLTRLKKLSGKTLQ